MKNIVTKNDSIVNSFLYAIDLFKSPLTLFFNKRQYISTRIGQLFSICIIIVEIIEFLKSDFLKHQSPSTLNSNLQPDHRPLVNLSQKLVAISIKDDDTMQAFIDPTVFSVDISNFFYISNQNGTGYNTSQIITKKTHPCQIEDFKDNEADFNNFGLANSLCLDDEENDFEVEGFWDEEALSVIGITLNICVNNTSDNTNESFVLCKTQDDIKEVMTGKSFNTYYKDIIIDVNDYENPIKSVIVNDYRYIDFNFIKTIDYYFQNIYLTDDEGLVFPEPKVLNEIGFVSINQDFYSRKMNETALLSINVYADKKVQYIQRVYMRIPDLLAKLGGIMQSLLLLGFVFVHFEYSLLLKNTILNALYSFKRPKQRKKRQDKKTNLDFNKNNKESGLLQKIIKVFSDKLTHREKSSKKNLNDKTIPIIPLKPSNLPMKFDREVKRQLTPGMPFYNFHSDKKSTDLKILSKCSKNQLSENPGFEETCNLNCQITPIKSPQNFAFVLTKSPLHTNNLSIGLNNHHTAPEDNKSEGFLLQRLKILKFQNFKQSSNNLYMNLLKYLKLGFKRMIPLIRMNYEEQLFSKSEKIYENDLDLLEILKKLQDIEKLKKILLNSNQQLLFNFLMKPLVYLNISDPKRLRKARLKYSIHLGSKVFENDEEELKRAIDDFERLAEQGVLSEVDKRIMNIIDRESSKFVKIAEDLSPRGKIQSPRHF